ncbi:hypothetical protein [Clostridium aceticum]|nr:hypothetical protein [Clostridium aceticum]
MLLSIYLEPQTEGQKLAYGKKAMTLRSSFTCGILVEKVMF